MINKVIQVCKEFILREKDKSNLRYDADFFKTMADEYINQSAWTKLRLQQVIKMVEPKKGDKILDMGCAAGAITHFCSKFGADVTGVDNSSLAIEKAKELFGNNSNIHFLLTDVSDLKDLKDESFDKAVSADLVEHIYQDVFEKMVKEVYRILKKGGTISTYTPCPTHIIERLKARNFILKQNPTHISVKSAKQIISTLKSCGFEIDMTYFTTSHYPVFNLIELVLKSIPLIGNLFRYRICVRAYKK